MIEETFTITDFQNIFIDFTVISFLFALSILVLAIFVHKN